MTKDDLKKMYEYIKIPEVEDQFAFRISEGKFKDVVYKYNKFGVNPDPNPVTSLLFIRNTTPTEGAYFSYKTSFQFPSVPNQFCE